MNMMRRVDLDQVRATAVEVRGALQDMPHEPFRGAKTYFPQGLCEWASIALAEVLAVRGLGDWTFVEMKLPSSLSGHAWRELRDAEGRAVFTIDITLDQFKDFDSWYMGIEQSPARQRFSRLNFAGPWREWPVLENNKTFAPYAQMMVDFTTRG
ncbi:hypothetical protein BJQ94_13780 [Cryobacterium sp. SO2]|uniref:hypothetical protein n=1 Tax=Cryobacterium sp. SO2 TaxID=1897060 RepID=UPI00223CAFF9|nr:hypothetical protein [Cryobacterium sp. SO2]WEO76428.1 hypothetical protein BJQ94_13780 [Cryobacterium sp. SO2]